jgi:hypothetical protein
MRKSSIPGRGLQCACWALAVLGALTLARGLTADVPSPPPGWRFDVVHLHTGRSFKGLVLKETPGSVRFQCIRQRSGEKTKLGPVTIFARYEILRMDRLDPKERADLEVRLEELKPAKEKERIERIQLKPAPWRGEANGGLTYASDHFVLTSNARDDIVRRAAVRLEQIYEAYARYLPPRCQKVTRTQILLVRSSAEYRQMLKKQPDDILNPAFFDPTSNQIVCATDLQKLAEELDTLRKKHQQMRDVLMEQQKALRKISDPPSEVLQKLAQLEREIRNADEENEKTFGNATERLFQTLYHEAFHAYLAGFVYPPGAHAVPRWLNEGLAQIFETAILEAGELRVEHADAERLKHVKEALRKNQLVAVADLLKANSDKFLVSHANSQQVSDAYYQGSWALAFYLTFGLRKLGTPELDDYVRSLKNGAEAEDAFFKLVGEPLPAFESSFHRYLRALHVDGSTAR